MAFPALLAVIGGIFLILVIWSMVQRNWRPKGYPPGPISWPLIGNLHQIGLEPYKSFVTLGKKYGPIFSVDYGSYRNIVINDARLMKQCLNESVFAGRPKFPSFLERTGPRAKFCRGIITSELQIWAEQRRFVVKSLKNLGFGKSSMETIIQEEVRDFVERQQKNVGIPTKTRGWFNTAILNSLWRISTGARIPQDDPKLQKLHEVILGVFSGSTPLCIFFPIITRLFPKLSGYNAVMAGNKALCDFVTEEYKIHKATLTPGEPRDLMDVLIEQVEATTDPASSYFQSEGEDNVIKSLEDLFLGGAETTSTTLLWLFLYISLYPDVQVKMAEEVLRVVGTSRLPELQDRPKMPYAESVIMETFRFSSVFPLSLMHCTTYDVNVGGYFIPKETVFTPNLYAVHHSQEIWGDPETFRPERFLLPDGTCNKAHEAVIPFSFGKRVCIGEKLARDQVFLFSTGLIQRFRCTLNPAAPKPSLKSRPTVVLSPNPYELILYDRI